MSPARKKSLTTGGESLRTARPGGSTRPRTASRGREHGRQLLCRGPSLERYREPHLVVLALPAGQCGRGSFVGLEAVPIPELLGVHAMTTLDLAVLIWAPRFDVSMADAATLHREEKRWPRLSARC